MFRRKRAYFCILLLVMALAGIMSRQVFLASHQATLNRALIVAVDKEDAAAVTTLLTLGADPNARDYRDTPPPDWLQTCRSILGRSSYDANAKPALAIAKDSGNALIQQILRERGADLDVVTHWHLTTLLPGEEEASTNGIHLSHVVLHPVHSEQMKNWIGKRVAFYCVLTPLGMMVAEGVYVEVEFAPTKIKPTWPIGWSSYLVGTVQSVDLKKKVIHVRLNFQDWHILDTG